VLWDPLEPYQPGKSQPFSDHLRPVALRKAQTEGETILPIPLANPSCCASTVRGMKGGAELPGAAKLLSSRPRAADQTLPHPSSEL